MLTALSYAELAGMHPSAGAEYEFASRAFNEFIGFVTGWMMVAALLIACGAVALGFAEYFNHFISADERLVAVGLLCVLALVVCSGIQRSIWLTVVLACLQVGGLVLVIVAGAPHVGERSLAEDATFTGILSGAALVFFAYVGFDEVVTLSEETLDAPRNVPRALLASLAISSALYILVAIAAVSAIGAEALGTSDRPFAAILEQEWGGRWAGVVAIIALAATTNTVLMALTAASRNLFGMARSGSLPSILARVSNRARAPYVAVVLGSLVAVGFALSGNIALVARVTDFSVYGIFIVVNLSLIALRFRAPHQRRPFAVPVSFRRLPILPMLGIAATVLMLAYLTPEAWAIGIIANGLAVATWLAIRLARSLAPEELKA
jgi:APA family basic amino acid/polyamine antiporter